MKKISSLFFGLLLQKWYHWHNEEEAINSVDGIKFFVCRQWTKDAIEAILSIANKDGWIVSGGAKGADTYAREFAKKKGLKLIEFFSNYEKYGKVAPLERNKLIVDECDCVLAFWDGQSHGTKFTLDYAHQLGKPIKIVNYITNDILTF